MCIRDRLRSDVVYDPATGCVAFDNLTYTPTYSWRGKEDDITRRPRPPAVITTASPSLFSIRVPFTIASMSAPHFILNCALAGPVAAWVSAMAMASAASSGRAISCM